MKLYGMSKSVRNIKPNEMCTLKNVYFHQKYEKTERATAQRIPEYSGELEVEGIIWMFNHDESTKKVTIACNLRPNSSRIVDEENVIRRYFSYFLQFPIRHLELFECSEPFMGIYQIRCPCLTWRMNNPDSRRTLGGLQGHVFERFNVFQPGKNFPFDFAEMYARTLIVSSTENDPLVANWDLLLHIFYGLLRDKRLQVTLRVCSIDTFVDSWCNIILNNNLDEGSFFTSIVEISPDLKREVWMKVKEKHRNVVETVFDERECLVLKTDESFITAVFHNYFERATFETETFTVIKLAK